jgi:hypothetical protein
MSSSWQRAEYRHESKHRKPVEYLHVRVDDSRRESIGNRNIWQIVRFNKKQKQRQGVEQYQYEVDEKMVLLKTIRVAANLEKQKSELHRSKRRTLK